MLILFGALVVAVAVVLLFPAARDLPSGTHPPLPEVEPHAFGLDGAPLRDAGRGDWR